MGLFGLGPATSVRPKMPTEPRPMPSDPALITQALRFDGGGLASAPLSPVTAAASAEAARGDEHVETPVAYDAILLASFGGPEGQDDVIPFLRNVTRGRGIPEERLEEVAHHYRAFGGVSPINEQNRALKKALEAELDRRGVDLPVLWGNRNWDPYLKDALLDAYQRGFRKLIAVGTSAYSSYSSCRQYREDYAMALAESGLVRPDGTALLEIDKVRQFFDHPGFVEPFVEGVRDGLAEASRSIESLDEVHVLFATHSIPTDDAVRSRSARSGLRRGRRVRRAAPRGRGGAHGQPRGHRVGSRVPVALRAADAAVARA